MHESSKACTIRSQSVSKSLAGIMRPARWQQLRGGLNELAMNNAIQPVQTSTERQDTFVIDTAKLVLPLRVVDTARLVGTSAAEHAVKAEPRRIPKEIYEDASHRISPAGRDRQMLSEKKEPQTVALGPQEQLPRHSPPQIGSTKMHTPGMFAAIPSQRTSYE